MAKKKLKDSEAKAILRKWPTSTNKLWGTSNGGLWVQAQPKAKGSKLTHPRLNAPGASLFSTQPDGLWLNLVDDELADIIAVEVCGTVSNFNDKRSRYAAHHSLMLQMPDRWLLEKIGLQGGGKKARWEALGMGTEPSDTVRLPVRHLRVLYSLPNDIYAEWKDHHTPWPHEYVCRHSSLDSYTGQKFQKFLGHMAPSTHLYP